VAETTTATTANRTIFQGFISFVFIALARIGARDGAQHGTIELEIHEQGIKRTA
jgi:hypothetical protein